MRLGRRVDDPGRAARPATADRVPVRALLALLVAVFLGMGGAGTLTTILSLRLAAHGVAAVVLGAVMAAYFLGLTLGSLSAQRLIRRVGHIRAFSAFLAMLSAAALGHSLGTDTLLWGGLRAVEGYCMAGVLICVESWLNQKASAANRGKILALYMVCLYGGYGAGQFLLRLDRGGFMVFAASSILLSLALVPVALTHQTPPDLPPLSALGVRRLFAASPVGAAGALTSGLASGALYALGPVYALRLGFDSAQAGLFMGAAVLGGVALQWPLGWLSDHFDRRAVLVGLFGALAVICLWLAVAPPTLLPWLLGAAALYGGMVFVVYPLSVAQTNDRLPASDMVAASGGLVLLYSVGATIGPLAASAMVAALGGVGLMGFTAVVSALLVGFGLWSMHRRPPVPAEEQGQFVAVPRTTPVVGVLAAGDPDEAAGG
jgi:MFS family permease